MELNDECDCAGNFYDGDAGATVEVQLPPSLQAAAPLAVTRAEYERVTAQLFERALIPVRQARHPYATSVRRRQRWRWR